MPFGLKGAPGSFQKLMTDEYCVQGPEKRRRREHVFIRYYIIIEKVGPHDAQPTPSAKRTTRRQSYAQTRWVHAN